jgi:sec-independent protein translocase protein TatC
MGPNSFLTHIEAFRKMVLEILTIFAVLLIPGWIFAGEVLNWIQHAAVKVAKSNGADFSLSYFSLMEPFVIELKTGVALAFAAGLPLYFWRFWKFLSPALYLREKKVILFGALAAWGLFAAGFALGLFGVMPFLVRFSVSFARDGLVPVIGLSNFIGMTMTVSLAFGAMFELPLLLLILCATGLIGLDTLKKQRPLVIVIILVLAAVLTPPDVVSQLMLAVPSYLLFELTLITGRFWLGKRQTAETPGAATDSIDSAVESTEETVDDYESSDYTESMKYYRRPRPARRRPEVNLSKYKKRK